MCITENLSLKIFHFYIEQQKVQGMRRNRQNRTEKAGRHSKNAVPSCGIENYFLMEMLLFQIRKINICISFALFRQKHHDLIAAFHKSAHCLNRQRLVGKHCQIVKLLAEHRYMLGVLMLENVLHKRMVCI